MAVAAIIGMGGKCWSVCGKEIGIGGRSCGVMMKRLEEMIAVVVFVVKMWSYVVVGIFRRCVE